MARGKRGRYDRDFTRRGVVREAARTFLIVVEGAATEPFYFNQLCRTLGLKTAVVIHHPQFTDPMNLVAEAARMAEERSASMMDDFDEVWIVFDRESQHGDRTKRIEPARRLATKHGHRTALTIPCFELWLFLHFAPRPGPLDTKAQAERVLKKHIPGYDGKTLPSELFTATMLREAMRHAEECANHHRTGGGDGNPSTEVHLLVRALNDSARAEVRLF